MCFTPVSHRFYDRKDGFAQMRDLVLYSWRYFGKNGPFQKAIVLQFSELPGEHLLANPLYPSLQQSKPVGAFINQEQNNGFPLASDLTHSKGNRAGLRSDRFIFHKKRDYNYLRISFSHFFVTK